MKLDRNINPDGRGKYALLNLRDTDLRLDEIKVRLTEALGPGVLEFGDNDQTEFFVIKLKDKYAAEALATYASKAREDGQAEYAAEIMELALKAQHHPCLKRPD